MMRFQEHIRRSLWSVMVLPAFFLGVVVSMSSPFPWRSAGALCVVLLFQWCVDFIFNTSEPSTRKWARGLHSLASAAMFGAVLVASGPESFLWVWGVVLSLGAAFTLSIPLLLCVVVVLNASMIFAGFGLDQVAVGTALFLLSPWVLLHMLGNAAVWFREREEEYLSGRSERDLLWRVPLTSVMGYAELLMEPSLPAHERLEYARVIQKHARRLMVGVSCATSRSARKAVADPLALVDDVLSLIAARADAQGVDLDVRVEGRLPAEVVTDPALLRHLLFDLLSVAVGCTAEGTVSLEGTTLCGVHEGDNARLCFSISCAVPVERFREVGNWEACEASVKLLGGELLMQGQAQSCVVTLVLDTGVSWLSLEDNASFRARTPAPRLDGVKVLVMERELDQQRLLAFFLRQAGASVTLVDSSQALWEELEGEGFFDLVLVDLEDESASGPEMLRRLKGVRRQGSVLGLSSSGDPKVALPGLDGVVCRPFVRQHFLEEVAKHTNPTLGVGIATILPETSFS